MTSLWAIIRSEDTDPDPEYEQDDPTICGIYDSREEAIEEILKLYIEDDIDEIGEVIGPSLDDIKEQRRRLIEDEIYITYTNLGNRYSLVNCMVGAKHEFGEDVTELYEKSV